MKYRNYFYSLLLSFISVTAMQPHYEDVTNKYAVYYLSPLARGKLIESTAKISYRYLHVHHNNGVYCAVPENELFEKDEQIIRSAGGRVVSVKGELCKILRRLVNDYTFNVNIPTTEDVIIFLLRVGGDINQRFSCKNIDEALAPCHVAAYTNAMGLLFFLIGRGADLNVCSMHNKTPLHYAVANNHPGIMRMLCRAGAYCGSESQTVVTPLGFAVITGKYPLLYIMLCEHGPAYSLTSSFQELLSLLASSVHNRKDNVMLVKLLLNGRADINGKAKDGSAPVHSAVMSGNDAILSLLIAGKADLECCNAHDETPLLMAVNAGNTKIIMMLLMAGVNTDRSYEYITHKKSLNSTQTNIRSALALAHLKHDRTSRLSLEIVINDIRTILYGYLLKPLRSMIDVHEASL